MSVDGGMEKGRRRDTCGNGLNVHSPFVPVDGMVLRCGGAERVGMVFSLSKVKPSRRDAGRIVDFCRV